MTFGTTLVIINNLIEPFFNQVISCPLWHAESSNLMPCDLSVGKFERQCTKIITQTHTHAHARMTA